MDGRGPPPLGGGGYVPGGGGGAMYGPGADSARSDVRSGWFRGRPTGHLTHVGGGVHRWGAGA
jgi:hypothetical protein